MGAWLRAELEPVLAHVLSKRTVESRGWFAWPAIEEAIELHRTSRADHTDHLLALLNLELWARIYLDKVPAADLSEELAERVRA